MDGTFRLIPIQPIAIQNIHSFYNIKHQSGIAPGEMHNKGIQLCQLTTGSKVHFTDKIFISFNILVINKSINNSLNPSTHTHITLKTPQRTTRQTWQAKRQEQQHFNFHRVTQPKHSGNNTTCLQSLQQRDKHGERPHFAHQHEDHEYSYINSGAG